MTEPRQQRQAAIENAVIDQRDCMRNSFFIRKRCINVARKSAPQAFMRPLAPAGDLIQCETSPSIESRHSLARRFHWYIPFTFRLGHNSGPSSVKSVEIIVTSTRWNNRFARICRPFVRRGIGRAKVRDCASKKEIFDQPKLPSGVGDGIWLKF
jgi:hypothetical protein